MSNDIRSELRSFPSAGDVTTVTPVSAQRVLRNTYALLGLTLIAPQELVLALMLIVCIAVGLSCTLMIVKNGLL